MSAISPKSDAIRRTVLFGNVYQTPEGGVSLVNPSTTGDELIDPNDDTLFVMDGARAGDNTPFPRLYLDDFFRTITELLHALVRKMFDDMCKKPSDEVIYKISCLFNLSLYNLAEYPFAEQPYVEPSVVSEETALALATLTQEVIDCYLLMHPPPPVGDVMREDYLDFHSSQCTEQVSRMMVLLLRYVQNTPVPRVPRAVHLVKQALIVQ
jgi:hypothetical protein